MSAPGRGAAGRRAQRTRRPRAKQAKGRSLVGERHETEVGPVAHGGHFVARVPTGATRPDGTAELRVVFVRHALPGERVVVEVTEGTEGDRFWRADAVEVLQASPDRVPPPCPYAGPALCGGCDFQHVDLARQRLLKADVVREQMSRLAGLDLDVVVEAVSGDVPANDEGLRWRTRMQYIPLPGGAHGLHEHRSVNVVEIDDCRIAHPDARVLGGPDAGAAASLPVVEQALGRDFSVEPDGFWQVHPGAPRVLVETVLELLSPQPGEKALDLYAGVGLFARFLAEAVGETGRVVAIEADRQAARHAGSNLVTHPRAKVATGTVDEVLATSYDEPFDLVVLDPPREGARRPVVEQIVDRAPRAVAYVACDPAALARDTAIFAEHGYHLDRLRAFDLFPMTQHVECVALIVRG